MTPAAQPQPRLRLRITPTAEWKLRSGHPWLYADSILEQNRDGQPGELAVIYDRHDNFLAIGLFDPGSPLRVRLLHRGKPRNIDSDWWRVRLREALDRRRGLFDGQTTGHRWINGESDGWPGLVLDRYDTTLVIKLYAAAWLPLLGNTMNLFQTELKPERLVLRLSRNIQARALKAFDLSDGKRMLGEGPDVSPLFLESGLSFEADVFRGQKTGFFLDQRENRRHVESLARGRDVLNAFSFSGGFSVYAARGGASSVTDLDISAHALDSAQRNFALNRSNPAVANCRHEAVKADAFEWLKTPSARKFGLIILDPPSLARREAERERAIHAYDMLIGQALKSLANGGVLVAASCSAHVSEEEFFQTVRGAGHKSGRPFKELQTTGHPPDHPATFPEAHYLKCIYLQF